MQSGQCFATTPEGRWLDANAYKHSFMIRYLKGKQQVTGYEYAPWHIRYVGSDLAPEMYDKSTLVLEEFFGVDSTIQY